MRVKKSTWDQQKIGKLGSQIISQTLNRPKSPALVYHHFGKFRKWYDFAFNQSKNYTFQKTNIIGKKFLERERPWMAELKAIYFGLNDGGDSRLELRRVIKE